MSKKTGVIICCCVIVIIIIALIPHNVNTVQNAVVNPDNGDIAFSYFDKFRGVDVIRITVFNKHGEELYSKSYLSTYTVGMIFDGDELCITVGRYDEKHSFDREGNETNNSIPAKEITKHNTFEGWKTSFKKETYSFEEYRYVYKKPSIISRNAKLIIENQEGEKVIYESP